MAKFTMNGMGFGEGTGRSKPSAPFKGEGKMKPAHKGFTKAERDAYRRKKINEGWKGDDLKAIMDAWKNRKKPTSITKISKEDLLASGGIGAE